MSALSFLIRNAGFAPASHVRVELFLPGSVISECCDYLAPSESFANEVLSSDRNFFDDLFCIDKSSSYEQYADTAARGESAFRPNLIKDNVTSVHGMWPSYDSGDFRADMEELLSGFEFVKTNNGKVVAKVSFDRVRMARLLRSRVVFCSLANAKCCTIGLDATNCLKPLRASCDRSIAKEKSERCPVETALVLKSILRCSQGDRRYHSGSICFALTLLRERELNDE